jgi:hypothetical protein
MPRLSTRKKRELRAVELRAILDPAKHNGYKAELARLEQWLALDDELSQGPRRGPGRPRRQTNGWLLATPAKRKPGRPRKTEVLSAESPGQVRRKRGRPRKVQP